MEQSARPARPDPGRAVPSRFFSQEAKGPARSALGAEIGFAERLAWFWSNHFCISADKAGLRAVAGAYERRGDPAPCDRRFVDMLMAWKASGMLIYPRQCALDRTGFGCRPQSRQGPNENLGPRDLELHTLGVLRLTPRTT